jgi:hypothetical protein
VRGVGGFLEYGDLGAIDGGVLGNFFYLAKRTFD